jgi:ubiquinone/menaquinone biosynthesis C-methylase UbiE
VYAKEATTKQMFGWASAHHLMMAPLMKCTRVLEVGTGTGMLLGFLASARVKVTSIDLSSAVLEVAGRFHEQLGVAVELAEGDGMPTPFPTDGSDAVFSQGLWEPF